MVTAEKASRSVVWAGLEIASLLLLSFVTLLVLARLLGPADFGLAALALVMAQFLNVFTRAIFIDALVQREPLEPAHLDTAFWASMAMAAALIGLAVLAAPALGRLFDEPALPAVFAWTVLGLAFSGADGVPVALLRRELRMKELAIRSCFGRVCGAVVGIGMAFAGYGVWSLVGQQIAIEAGNALAAYRLTGWRPAGRGPSLRHLRELARFALPWLGGEVLLYGNLRFFSLLVGYLFGTVTLGYVNVGFRLVGTLGQALEVAAHQVSLPIFARLRDDLPALRGALRQATAVASFLVAPLFIGMAVCAEPVVVALLGADWRPAVPFVRLITVATLLQFLLAPTSSLYSAVGRPIWRFWRGAVDLSVTVIGLIALAGLGPIAAGLVWLGRFLVLIPFSCYGMRRLVRLEAGRQLRALMPSAVAAGLMVAAVLTAWQHLPPDWGAAPTLAVLVPVGGVTYLAAFALVGRPYLREYLDHARLALTSAGRRPSST